VGGGERVVVVEEEKDGAGDSVGARSLGEGGMGRWTGTWDAADGAVHGP
jgi:hypothetical protein